MILGLQRRLARGDRFGLCNRRRRLRRAAIEIGDRGFSLRGLRRREFVADRTRKPVLAIAAATTAASAPAAAAARTALAIALIVATGKARLLLGLVLLGFAFLALRLRALFGNRSFAVFARMVRVAWFPTAATAPPAALSAALAAILFGFAVAGFACFFGEAFGFLGFNLGLQLRIEAVIVIGGFVSRASVAPPPAPRSMLSPLPACAPARRGR